MSVFFYLFATDLAQERVNLRWTLIKHIPKTFSGQALVCSSGTMASTFSLLFKLFINVYIEITGSVVKCPPFFSELIHKPLPSNLGNGPLWSLTFGNLLLLEPSLWNLEEENCAGILVKNKTKQPPVLFLQFCMFKVVSSECPHTPNRPCFPLHSCFKAISRYW